MKMILINYGCMLFKKQVFIIKRIRPKGENSQDVNSITSNLYHVIYKY